MSGAGQIRFSELFADTVRTHGLAWSQQYYCGKHKMPAWEFEFWCVLVGAFESMRFGTRFVPMNTD
jgi:hypothetical protein